MEDKVPTIMENVFECTLEMINKDFSEYPEHRVEFFKLLKAINLYCFPALLKLDGRQFKFVIDSCMWASKHDNREVENTGLSMCNELMDNMAEVSDRATSGLFFQQFFVPILQDVFFVLTDPDHKSGKAPGLPSSDCHAEVARRFQIAVHAPSANVLSSRVRADIRSRVHICAGTGWHQQQGFPAELRWRSVTKSLRQSPTVGCPGHLISCSVY